MADHLPYLSSPGTLNTALKKIKAAKTPERFTRDFLNTVLDMRGGSANAVIPFLKKVGILNSDGSPTALYDQLRNPATAGAAVAAAMRRGYDRLYEANEYAHKLSDADLKGLIVQITGAEKDSRAAELTVSTFKKMKAHADFNARKPPKELPRDKGKEREEKGGADGDASVGDSVTLSYTINLHLPPSTNIEVFNAIFRSLREHLLED